MIIPVAGFPFKETGHIHVKRYRPSLNIQEKNKMFSVFNVNGIDAYEMRHFNHVNLEASRPRTRDIRHLLFWFDDTTRKITSPTRRIVDYPTVHSRISRALKDLVDPDRIPDVVLEYEKMWGIRDGCDVCTEKGDNGEDKYLFCEAHNFDELEDIPEEYGISHDYNIGFHHATDAVTRNHIDGFQTTSVIVDIINAQETRDYEVRCSRDRVDAIRGMHYSLTAVGDKDINRTARKFDRQIACTPLLAHFRIIDLPKPGWFQEIDKRLDADGERIESSHTVDGLCPSGLIVHQNETKLPILPDSSYEQQLIVKDSEIVYNVNDQKEWAYERFIPCNTHGVPYNVTPVQHVGDSVETACMNLTCNCASVNSTE